MGHDADVLLQGDEGRAAAAKPHGPELITPHSQGISPNRVLCKSRLDRGHLLVLNLLYLLLPLWAQTQETKGRCWEDKTSGPSRQEYDQGKKKRKRNHCGSDVALKEVFKGCWISILGDLEVGLDTPKFPSNLHPSLTLWLNSLLALYKLYHHLVTYILIHKILPNGHFYRLFIHDVYLFIRTLSIKLKNY